MPNHQTRAFIEAYAAPAQLVSSNDILEKSLATAAYTSPDGDVFDVANRALYYEENLVRGMMPEDVEAVKTTISRAVNDSRKELLIQQLADDTLSIYEKKALVDQFHRSQPENIPWRDAFQAKVLDNSKRNPPPLRSEQEAQALAQQELPDKNVMAKSVQEAAWSLGAGFDSSTSAALFGFLEMFLPFNRQAKLQAVREAAFNGEEGWMTRLHNMVFPGTSIGELRKWLGDLPPEKREEAHHRMISAIGNLWGQDMDKMFILQDLITDPYKNWQAFVDNAVGVLDAVLIGTPLRRVLGLPGTVLDRPAPYAPISLAARASREAAARAVAAGIVDGTGKVARQFGTTREQMLGMALPKSAGEFIDDMPEGVATLVRDMRNRGDDFLAEVNTSGVNMYTHERDALSQTIAKELDDVVTGPVFHEMKSELYETGDMLVSTARYGKTERYGYTNFQEALREKKKIEEALAQKNELRELMGDLDHIPEINIVKRAKDGSFVTMRSGFEKGAEYFIQVHHRRPYSQFDVQAYGNDLINQWSKSPLSPYYQSQHARWDMETADQILRTRDRSIAIDTFFINELQKAFKGLGRVTGRKNRTAFQGLVEDGANLRKTFSPTEIRDRLRHTHSPDEIEHIQAAYYIRKEVEDYMWALENKMMRDQLEADGWRQLVDVHGQRHFIHEPTSTPAGRVPYYNAISGEVEKMSADQVKRAGGIVFDLRSPYRYVTKNAAGEDEVNVITRVFVPNEEHKVLRSIGRVDQHVLPYLEGYYHRAYRDTYYFVDRFDTTAKLDGIPFNMLDDSAKEKLKVTVATARSEREAMEQAARLSSETGENLIYRTRIGREQLDNSLDDQNLYNMLTSNSRRRGQDQLITSEFNRQAIEDPFQATLRSVQGISDHFGMADYISKQKARWVKTFASNDEGGYKFVKPEARGTYPGADDFLPPSTLAEKQIYDKAMRMWEHINGLGRTTGKAESVWHNTFFKIADTMDLAYGSKRISGLLRDVGSSNPFKFTRTAAATAFIALRPLRQWLLQPAQLTQMLFLDPTYVGTGRLLKDIGAIRIANLAMTYAKSPTNQKVWMKVAADLMGVNEKEMKEVWRQYYQLSGLHTSTSRNVMVEDWFKSEHHPLLDNTIVRPLADAANLVKRTGERVGFTPAENMNLTGSWLLALRRWQKNNPGKAHLWHNKSNRETIAAQARNISYSMTRAGAFEYQKGLLGTMLQFQSVGHKAWMQVASKHLGGDKMFTSSEKMKLVAANFVNFGAYAFGMYKLVDMLRDKLIAEGMWNEGVEEYWDIFKGGMTSLSFNALLQQVFDTEELPKINLAQDLSPFASYGIPLLDYMSELAQFQFTSDRIAPGLHLYGRIGQMLQDNYRIWAREELTTPEKWQTAARKIAGIAGGFNDHFKAKFILKYGRWISANGSSGLVSDMPNVDAMAAYLGLRNWQMEDYYKVIREEYGRTASLGTDGVRRAMEKDVKTIYQSMLRTGIDYEDGRISERAMSAELDAYAMLLDVYGVENQAEIAKILKKLEAQENEDGRRTLTDIIIRRGATTLDQQILLIQANDAIPGPMKKQLIDFVTNAFQINQNLSEGFPQGDEPTKESLIKSHRETRKNAIDVINNLGGN